eukprot:3404990-Rhodomonas_salina.2
MSPASSAPCSVDVSDSSGTSSASVAASVIILLALSNAVWPFLPGTVLLAPAANSFFTAFTLPREAATISGVWSFVCKGGHPVREGPSSWIGRHQHQQRARNRGRGGG